MFAYMDIEIITHKEPAQGDKCLMATVLVGGALFFDGGGGVHGE